MKITIHLKNNIEIPEKTLNFVKTLNETEITKITGNTMIYMITDIKDNEYGLPVEYVDYIEIDKKGVLDMSEEDLAKFKENFWKEFDKYSKLASKYEKRKIPMAS